MEEGLIRKVVIMIGRMVVTIAIEVLLLVFKIFLNKIILNLQRVPSMPDGVTVEAE
tara:strand:- start:313 stop:480 length:168 start_codon:yes stop_codon:yes gene_type:complete